MDNNIETSDSLLMPESFADYSGQNFAIYYSPQYLENPEYVDINDQSNGYSLPIMDDAASDELLKLLSQWNLACLHQTCVDELVDLFTLKYITPTQCNLLTANFPLGIKIKFAAEIMRWRGY